MHHREPSRIERLEWSLGFSLKSLARAILELCFILLLLGWFYIGLPLKIEPHLLNAPALTKTATITEVTPQYRKTKLPYDKVTLDLGDGIIAQANATANFQVGEKVIAKCRIGKSGRYYVESIEPIQKPERKVLLP